MSGPAGGPGAGRAPGEEPIVSVVIAARNAERHLAGAIESVRAQTYPRVELLVVDGQSVDATARIAASYEGVRVIAQVGRGLSDAWNCGVAASRGALIAFLDSDDRWTPDKLRLQVSEMDRRPEVGWVDGRVRYVLEPGAAPPAGFRPELLGAAPLGRMPGTILVRRALLERTAFDANLAIAGDLDWFARVHDAGVLAGAVDAVVLHKRVHATSLSLGASGTQRFGPELLRLLRDSVSRKRRSGDG